jgi:hypothetical protein
MTPPTPSRPVRITAETQSRITFPCWMWDNVFEHWFVKSVYPTSATAGLYTHWLPYDPERPAQPVRPATESPDWETQALSSVDIEPTPTAPDLQAKNDSTGGPLRPLPGTTFGLPAPIPVTAPLPESEGETDGMKPAQVAHDLRQMAKRLCWGRPVDIPEDSQQWAHDVFSRAATLCLSLESMERDRESALAMVETWRVRSEAHRQAAEAANAEAASLRTLLATAEKERDDWREATRVQTEKLIALNGENARLRTLAPSSLTPSAAQSAEMEKRVSACVAEIGELEHKGMSRFASIEDLHADFNERVGAVLRKHFTTPTQ